MCGGGGGVFSISAEVNGKASVEGGGFMKRVGVGILLASVILSEAGPRTCGHLL